MRPRSAKHPAPQGLMGPNFHVVKKKQGKKQKFNLPTGQKSTTFYRNDKFSETQRRILPLKLPSEDQMKRESLQYKQDTNTYKLENIQLKTKIRQFIRDIDKKQKIIDSIIEKLNTNNEGFVKLKADSETSLVLSLKRQVKELKDKLDIKTDTWAKMDQYMKTTQVTDTELQISNEVEKCREIRSAIENAQLDDTEIYNTLENIKQIEEKLKEQNDAMADLRRNNDQIAILIKRKNGDIHYQFNTG